jgi:glycosyltransferase involved in cell wall biosynthesis
LKRIIVSVTNDLATDQRVNKVCNFLLDEGFDVLLIGRQQKDSLPVCEKYKTKRIQLLFNKGFLFYAEYNFRLFFMLLFSKKDILLSNDLDTLLANFLISKIQSKKIVYDSHELFPEVPELVNRLFVKKCWSRLEKWILPQLKNTYTVCNSIANYYDIKYGTNFKVVRNLPTLKNIKTSSFPFAIEDKKIILYQGAINIGRGLELMIDTIKYLPNYIFVVIGDGDLLKGLKEQIIKENLEAKVKFLGKLNPKDLQKITPLANLGISLEEDLGLNYRFALPNKIFDYIQAELPVLVSNLPEMKQVVNKYKVGEIAIDRNPKSLAKQIVLFSKINYTTALKTSKKILVWNNEIKQLKEIFSNLL